ncbi:MAG: hypothetical protein H6Q69_1840 [Firmicutes bacterium]|nr:hypothetical protein [Bacillota bacterium]
MNTRQLEYFLAVADLKSFTKAAQKFYISQTAISQQIKILEEDIGVQLFFRTKKSVKLTYPGEVFYNDVNLIVNNINEAVIKIKRADSGYSGLLKIGFIPNHGGTDLVSIVQTLKKSYPLIDLSITEGSMEHLYKLVEDQSLDIVFSIAADLGKYPHMHWKSLKKMPLYFVVHKNHPLANQERVSGAELKTEKFILLNSSDGPYGMEKLLRIFSYNDLFSQISKQAHSLEEVFLMVRSQMGVTISPKYSDNYDGDLVYIKIDHKDAFLESVVAWNATSVNPALPVFLKYI